MSLLFAPPPHSVVKKNYFAVRRLLFTSPLRPAPPPLRLSVMENLVGVGWVQEVVRTLFTGRTVIMVAHRLNTIIDCDQV